MNFNAISAVFKRQLGSFLGNPVGYIFILAFVCITGIVSFWDDEFYRRSIADFALIYDTIPLMLAVLLPALAMGAWTSEREQGTEELVLTLPISVFDAVIGKYLAIAAFFTIAMVANLSNVVVMSWLGDPDIGLVLANYIGWWSAGLAFAALGLLASVQVRSQAIAFVLGVIYASILLLVMSGLAWMAPFERGVVSFGNILIVLGVIGVGLGFSIVWLSSRLWRAEQQDRVVFQIINLVLGMILLVQVGRIVDRSHLDADISADGLSSISETSVRILNDIEHPIKLSIFISQDLPEEMLLKSKEVIDTVNAIDRSAGDRLETRIFRPQDVIDRAATIAQEDYELQPRKLPGDTITGRDLLDVFFSAVVTSQGVTEKIEYFEPGLSVEYELVRAIRAVDQQLADQLPVVGIMQTEIEMTDQFDFRTSQNRPAWQLVQELRRQYEVVDVYPDNDIDAEVDVLLVPMPSGLTQEQIERLHDYIYNGGATLLLEDPFPYFELGAGRQIAPSLPRASQNQQMPGMPPPPDEEPKGDIAAVYQALGLSFDLHTISWSNYLPTGQLGGLPKPIVWSTLEDGGVYHDSAVTTGLQQILTVYPGAIRPLASDQAELDIAQLSVHPLLTLNQTRWGTKRFSDFIFHFPGRGIQGKDPGPFIPTVGDRPWLAVEVRGKMPRAYNNLEDTANDAADTPEAAVDAEESTEPTDNRGELSQRDVHVIVIADVDLAHDNFFNMYRQLDTRNSADLQRIWASLNNVQFIANAIDVLAGQTDLVALRSRRAKHRMLTRMQDVLERTEQRVADVMKTAQEEASRRQDEAQAAFDKKLADIQAREDLDEASKNQLVAAARASEQRKLDRKAEEIRNDAVLAERKARSEQREVIRADRNKVKILAIGVPAVLLLLLIGLVSAQRLMRERIDIPNARKRSDA